MRMGLMVTMTAALAAEAHATRLIMWCMFANMIVSFEQAAGPNGRGQGRAGGLAGNRPCHQG